MREALNAVGLLLLPIRKSGAGLEIKKPCIEMQGLLIDLRLNKYSKNLSAMKIAMWFKGILLAVIGRQNTYSDRKDWSVNYGEGSTNLG